MNSEILSDCEAGNSFKTLAGVLSRKYHPEGKSYLTQLIEVMENQRSLNDNRVLKVQSGE